PQPRGRALKKRRLIEKMLAALDIPNHVKRMRREGNPFRIIAHETDALARTLTTGGDAGPHALQWTERNARRPPAIPDGQIDGAAAHATPDIEDVFIGLDRRGTRQAIDQATLGQGR